MTFELIIFMVSAVVAVFGATMMIAQRNPVASVLYMILSLVAQAVCYVQLGALFLGAILVIVYAGAIMVLFLFVIMLLNLRGVDETGPPVPPLSIFTKYIFAVLLVMELVFIIREAPVQLRDVGRDSPALESFGSIKMVAETMFTDYLYPFELTGILLLAAIVGAVVLAKKESVTDQPDDGKPTREKVE